LVRFGAVAWQENKQVVFSFWSVLGLLLGNDNKPLPWERGYRASSFLAVTLMVYFPFRQS
jgi:hypothetical protein